MLEGYYSPSNIDGPRSSITSLSSYDDYLGSGAAGGKSIESPRIDFILLSNASLFYF